MTEFLHLARHLIVHSLVETAKTLPFLFLTYLLMEFLEHKSGNAAGKLLQKSGKIGPLIGAGLGAFPQCGFSAAASGLYAGRVITAGTLLAVFLSTSDEMLPVLISNGQSLTFMLALLGCKVVIGITVGFSVDLIMRAFRHRQEPAAQAENFCHGEHCHCGDHFVIAALKHTLQIGVYLLLFTFLFHGAVELIGKENLTVLADTKPFIGNLITSLIGLIPNCAASVVLTELHLSGIISVGAMMSGLLVNAGVGLLILFRNNRPVTDSLKIVLILFAAGLFFGFLMDITPISDWLVSLK